jgi:hypothetical protein
VTGDDAQQQSAVGQSPFTPATSSKRQQLEDVLRLRFGYHLFEGQAVLLLVCLLLWL